jgi:CheY-like chemotaxis protein/anti-sigma regulatory factor (Ser/Thr protein kinase)
VRLVFDDPEETIELYTDEAKVSQILRNFISNALKFTERGEVRVSVSRDHDNVLRFAVSDTGIGISDEDQERIFLEWTQVEGRLQKAAKGSGLGLPLSRKLAQLMGGNVYVKSQVGVGSTFIAAIPIRFKGETEVVYVPDVKPELDASKLPVLVVEDNREALFIYEKYLKATRFQVIPAKNVKEAREALRAVRPVAIILDVLLQSEHSWDLLRDVKQDPDTSDIPVFVVTVVDNRSKAMALGANGFHPKPVDRAWLLNQLASAEAGQPRARVLVIDDDETSRYLVKGVLAPSQCQVWEADGGVAGLRMAREFKPGMIVLDLSMPDLGGFEVLEQLRQDPETRDIPIVIHTSKVLDGEDEARLQSALDVIPKSIMTTRDAAAARFGQSLRKAGLAYSNSADSEALARQ